MPSHLASPTTGSQHQSIQIQTDFLTGQRFKHVQRGNTRLTAQQMLENGSTLSDVCCAAQWNSNAFRVYLDQNAVDELAIFHALDDASDDDVGDLEPSLRGLCVRGDDDYMTPPWGARPLG